MSSGTFQHGIAGVSRTTLMSSPSLEHASCGLLDLSKRALCSPFPAFVIVVSAVQQVSAIIPVLLLIMAVWYRVLKMKLADGAKFGMPLTTVLLRDGESILSFNGPASATDESIPGTTYFV